VCLAAVSLKGDTELMLIRMCVISVHHVLTIIFLSLLTVCMYSELVMLVVLQW